MTERLKSLLHDEADALSVPAPSASRALADGRRLRRRRRLVPVATAAAVVLVAGGLAFTLGGGDDRDRDDATAADPAASSAPVLYAAGSTVVIGDRTAEVPDTVHSLHYTSAGVLVRSNANDGASDGSGPENLTLVREDGTTVDLGVIPEGVGPATDPDEPVYALAEADGAGFKVVVRDAATGDVVQEMRLPDGKPSYWPVPPLALDGDTLYVGFDSTTAAVDLTTGDSHTVDGMSGGIPEVLGGRTVVQGRGAPRVMDVATGATVYDYFLTTCTRCDREPRQGADPFSISLSPTGASVLIETTDRMGMTDRVWVHDIDAAEQQELAGGDTAGWGWTADGHPFSVTGRTVTSCDPTSGICDDLTAPVTLAPNDFPRLGGRVYES